MHKIKNIQAGKEAKNITHNEKKNQSRKSQNGPDDKINRKKDIKRVIITIFHIFKNLGRDMEDIKKGSLKFNF